MILELFCGTAGVSASFKRRGFTNCIAIGKNIAKLPKATVTKLDLANRANQFLVLDWIRSPQVKGVYLAPPCGTASAARNIPRPEEQHAPPPLRSVLQPHGLDNLTGTNFERVSQANILYSFVAECFDLCCELNKLVMVENPENPLF